MPTVLDNTSTMLAADISSYLQQFGLEELGPWAASMAGVSESEFIVALEQQEAYRIRFAPVFERRRAIAAGEATVPITPQMVISAEAEDRRLEQEYGLPQGMIDTAERLNADVSSNEVRSRVQLAVEDAQKVYQTEGGRAFIDAAFDRIPGVTEGGIVALFLDPDVALPKLQDSISAARVASGADAAGFRLTNKEAVALQRQGFTEQAARQGFDSLQALGELASPIVGEQGGEFTRADQIALVAGDQAQQDRLEERARRRIAAFGGGGGFAGGTAGLA